MSGKLDIIGPLKVVGVVGENIKRIRLVNINVTEPGVVEVSGANDAGKSSLCDLFQYALLGKKAIPSVPITLGEDEGFINVDLDGITVRREFYRAPDPDNPDDDGSRIIVTTKAGARIDAPQGLLNEIWNKRALDPVEWAERLTPRQQLVSLAQIVGVDIDKFEALIKEVFDERTGVGREVKRLSALVETKRGTIGPDWPTEPVDVQVLLSEMAEAAEFNRAIEKESGERQRRAQQIQHARNNAGAKLREAEELERRIQALRDDAATLIAGADRAHAELAALPPLDEPRDVDALKAKVTAANDQNEKQRQRAEFAALEQDLADVVKEHERLDEEVYARRARRDTAIVNAKWPLPGLGFDLEKGEVTYNGLPLSQASTSGRIKVSLAVLNAEKPHLPLVIIRGWSLLDEKSQEVVKSFCRENGLYVFAEVVDTSGERGIYLEAGRVVKVNEGTPATALV